MGKQLAGPVAFEMMETCNCSHGLAGNLEINNTNEINTLQRMVEMFTEV